jgi:hypothetical protein
MLTVITLSVVIVYIVISVLMMYYYVSPSGLVNHCDPSTEIIMIACFPGTMFWVGVFALKEIRSVYDSKTSQNSKLRIHH